MSSSKPDLTTTAGRLQDLRNRLEEAQAPVGPDAIEAVHTAGETTARERVLALLDEGSFVETDALARHNVEAYKMDRTRPATDGVITGYGHIEGRRVCVFSQDTTVFDGAVGEVYAEKILKLYELAIKTGVPLVGIYDSVGPRWQEGIVTAALQAKILRAATTASGLIPQIAVVAGTTAGLSAVTVPLSDIVVVAQGASVQTGPAHLRAATSVEAVAAAREVLSFLPENNRAGSPIASAGAAANVDLNTFMPDDDAATYEVRDIITAITDGGLFELSADYADNIVTGFAHISGRAVGIVANQPLSLDGQITAVAARKAARFIRTCDAFNMPVVTLVDSPGFLPADDEVVSGASTLAYAYAEAQVGTVTVVTHKAFGSSYAIMGSKYLGADLVFAWPTAQIALASAASAATALNTDAETYAAENLNPYIATERGLVDSVIEPSHTRTQVLEALRLLERKVVYPPAKKHGNIPL
ncbi:acyl-CoA carboxylase subunit beta [Corynebacterium mayonis]|uniref:acyl-CoA carboxylase subunit beta n=1 Tax=Corynebacterium mayonis TaxID=3062461 RepID=UPI003140331A